MSDDKTIDAARIDAENKYVAEINSLRLENGEMKRKVADQESVQKLREEWAKEQSEVKKEIEEIKRNVDNSKVIRGVVKETVNTTPDPISQLDKVLPNREKNPERYASNIKRWGHYKNATTASYNREQLGMALSLHAGAQRMTRGLIAPSARPERSDIVLNKGKYDN